MRLSGFNRVDTSLSCLIRLGEIAMTSWVFVAKTKYAFINAIALDLSALIAPMKAT